MFWAIFLPLLVLLGVGIYAIGEVCNDRKSSSEKDDNEGRIVFSDGMSSGKKSKGSCCDEYHKKEMGIVEGWLDELDFDQRS